MWHINYVPKSFPGILAVLIGRMCR